MFVLIIIINGFIIKCLMQYIENETIINTQNAYSESINDLFQTIKSQRHDFNNHVQVVYGMITENLISEAKAYIKDVYKETKEINEILVVDRPELAALLKAKYSKAVFNNIQLVINVKCKLAMLHVKPHDLVRIIGNLMDNAIEATALLNGPDKEVSLLINKQDSKILIETINPGTMPKETEAIFKAGVSMKEGHSGLGLYIVKKIVESYQGEITLHSFQGKLNFIVSLPCK